jgi:hypothetical protein
VSWRQKTTLEIDFFLFPNISLKPGANNKKKHFTAVINYAF